ncbi:MAG: 4-nitrophenyl phosphatase [Myxococcota bacterium]|jgi:4-nitrophenyl phosphatase
MCVGHGTVWTPTFRAMSIIDRYAALVLDLDGVVFRGDDPIRGASTFLKRSRKQRPPMCFVTNSSARTPKEWAELCARHKLNVDADDILTSATATAELLRQSATQTAFVLGEFGLREALRTAGIGVVADAGEAEAVVVGWDRSLTYEKLRDAAAAIDRGARFVATNPDRMVPVNGGRVPGTGATVAFLRTATGVAPEIVGKPLTGMFELARARLGVDGPVLVVGDQVTTDVAAARAMGWDAALVRSGLDSWPQLVDATVTPTWVIADLSGLDGPEPPVVRHAREQDITAIRELLGASSFDVEGAAGRLRTTLIAESASGAVVGCISWELVETAAHLRGITVAQAERGFGTGSHLIARALQELRRDSVEWAYLLTPGADQLFEKLGFWRVHRDRVPEEILATAQYGGPADGAVALVRRLSS